ncbi:hypothetical protein [Streptomyces sp. NPDC005805]|uniref:hypothetical protein n=1 Tax=Streptomyces sp. NPDC005805 TaxID=3157068 RepID=UPI0033F93564
MRTDDGGSSTGAPDTAGTPSAGGSGTSTWTTRVSVLVAVIALGTSVYMAFLAKAADDRAEEAEDRAKTVQARADEAQKKSQAQFVSHHFETDSNGVLTRLIVENRGQMPIHDVFVNLKELGYYVRFERIPGCRQQRVEPLVVNAVGEDQQVWRYDLTGNSTVSVRFTDDQGTSWEKGSKSGLRTIDEPGPVEGAVDASQAFAQNQAHYLEDVPNCGS